MHRKVICNLTGSPKSISHRRWISAQRSVNFNILPLLHISILNHGPPVATQSLPEGSGLIDFELLYGRDGNDSDLPLLSIEGEYTASLNFFFFCFLVPLSLATTSLIESLSGNTVPEPRRHLSRRA